jgi:CelD/BcsL family acetyltransferase involved in cellulose biosynthesis
MRTIWVEPDEDPRWQTLLAQTCSDVFHSPAWIKVLQSTYGFKIRALVGLDREDRPLAGLPIVRLSDLRGERLVALPFSDYCDPLGESPEAWTGLAAELLKPDLPVRLRCLHNTQPLSDPRFEVAGLACWHGLNLEGEPEALWSRFDGAARRAIRKAMDSGIQVVTARDEAALRAFYNLHLRVRKTKYRLLAQPYRFFKAIWSHFLTQGQGVLLLAYQDGALLAGTLYLVWHDTLYYKFNASDPIGLSYRPNDLLVWEGIRFAIAHGLRRFDFGLSDADQEGLLRFKRKFGTTEKPITFLQHRSSSSPNPTTDGFLMLLGELTRLLTETDVPDVTTEAAGDLLYRFFG